MTDIWQGGKTYVPGALVKPSSTTVVAQPQPTNGDFETGDLTGWAQGASRWTNTSTTPYAGTKCVVLSGSGIDSLNNTNVVPVKPGQRITAQAMAKLTNNGTNDQGAQIIIVWRDASHAELPNPELGTLIYGQGGYWKLTSASGAAPAGTAEAFIRLNGNNGTHGGTLEFDQVSWSYAYQAPPPGLIFKATQAAPGKSGSAEPTWPTTVGVPVTDNEVTWEGVIASRVVWEASPIMQTGDTEPVWPLSAGAIVHDGNMDWVAISSQITDKNCPNSKVVAIMASKVFAADKDIVRFSATVNPLDWTSSQDAGYLPTGLQQANSNDMTVLAPYRSNLTAFNASSFQNWQVDPDPSAMSLLDQMEGIGSSAQHAAQPVGNDLFYLSQLGVRSVSIAAGTESLAAGDVGIPVDSLVQASLAYLAAKGFSPPRATYYPSAGQYWLAFDSSVLSISGLLPDGMVGAAGTYQYTATNAAQPVTYTIASGSLPPGATMNASGLVTYTYTTGGRYSWAVQGTDALSQVATLSDSATVWPAEALSAKPKIVSWWDFEFDLMDQARGGNTQGGTVAFVVNATDTGKKLAEGTTPRVTTGNKGFNFYRVGEYGNFAFGARLTVSKLTNVTRLLTVGADSGSSVTGVLRIGINASGKWEASLYNASNVAVITVASTSSAAVGAETHVGVNGVYTSTNTMTLALVINGAQEAVSASTPSSTLAVNTQYVIGTREGTGYAPAVSEMFWAHDSLTAAEWAYLNNAGNKRFYADFGGALYGTTYDAYLASLMAAKAGGIFKFNAASGTVAVNSAPFGSIGDATLTGGATYSAAIAPPPGFGGDPVLRTDGINGRVITNTGFAGSTNSGGELMSTWVSQPSDGVNESFFMELTRPAQPWTGQRALLQGANASQAKTYYNDFSGNSFRSGVATAPGVNEWKMLTWAGFDASYFAPVVNGIVGSSPGQYGASAFSDVMAFVVGAYYGGTSAVNAYFSRTCVLTSGNFTLPQLAKLYDLGAGLG